MRVVLERHFDHHGEDYYHQAKSIRTQTEDALHIARQAVTQAAPDPVRDLAKAARLIRGKTKGFKQPLKGQLNLFGEPQK